MSDRIQPAAFGVQIESLGLSIRAKNALHSIGVISVSDLIERVRITGLEANKLDCRGEINSAFRALLRAVSTVDWPTYQRLRDAETGLPRLPSRKSTVWSPEDFVKEFPDVVRNVVRLQFGPRHSLIAERRILSAPGQRWTLARVGEELGVTRNRIHSIEKRIILILRRSLLENDYRRFHFRIDSHFAEPVKELNRATLISAKGCIARTTWAKLIRDVWGMDVKAIANIEFPILEILDKRICD